MTVSSSVSVTPKKLKYPGAGIIAKYEEHYEWLYFSTSRHGYVCKYCELFGESRALSNPAVFVTGTLLGDHPIRKLEKHQSSDSHKDAKDKHIKSLTGRCLFNELTSKETKYNKKRIEINRSYVKALIDTVFLVITNRWALDRVQDIMRHCENLECKPISKFKTINKVLDYTSCSSITNIL